MLYRPCTPVITPICKPNCLFRTLPMVLYGSNQWSKQHLLPECCHRSFTLCSTALLLFRRILACWSVVDSADPPAAASFSGGRRSLPYETALDERRLGGAVDPPTQ